MATATIGSVSSGTLRPQDLAAAFLAEIDRLRLEISDDLRKDAESLARGCGRPVSDYPLPEDADEIVAELAEILDSAANPGWFFGAHPGDGADFGFWPVEEKEPKTLRLLLEAAGSRWVEADWTGSKNEAIDDIIDRFDDCPEALQDFDRSDWVNMAECYNRDLLNRWDQQEDDIKALFNDYCEAVGYTSTLEVLEGETIEDPDDMAMAMVNHAMTYAARMLLDEIREAIE
jgi:hypothetical protein